MPVYTEEAEVPSEVLEAIKEGSSLLQKRRDGIAEENRWGDLTRLSASELISMNRVTRFWCMDAIIRLHGVPHKPDWKLIFKEAYGLAARLNVDFDFQSRLLLHSRDAESALDLIKYRLGWDATRVEILRRFEQLRFGNAFRRSLKKNDFDVGDLLDVTESQIRAWLRAMKIKKEEMPRTIDLLKSLKLPLKALPREHVLEDDRGEALLTIHELYDELKNAVKTDSVPYNALKEAIKTGVLDEIPTNPIIERRPLENPRWERKLRRRMFRDIQKRLKKHLPILDGSMEKAPLKVIDAHRTRVRRELWWEGKITSWDELNDQEHSGDDDEGFPPSKLEIESMKVVGSADPVERAHVINTKEKFDKLLELELKNVNPPRKRAQVREAIHLVVYEDKTVKEAANIKGVSEKTLQKYKEKTLQKYKLKHGI